MTTRGFQNRCVALCALAMLGLTGLSVRLIQLQVWDRKYLQKAASRAHDRKEVLPGLRGKIVDRHEEVLAKSMPVSSVIVDIDHFTNPKLMAYTVAYDRVSRLENWKNLKPEEKRRLLKSERMDILRMMPPEAIHETALAICVNHLARPLGMKREELRKAILEGVGERKRGIFVVKKNLRDDVARGIQQIIDDAQIEGFKQRSSYRRYYTSPDLATHALGFTGEKTIEVDGKKNHVTAGMFGVEAAMEDYLRGMDGWREEKRDQTGMKIPGGSESIMPPRAGLNVQLTLDMTIQAIVEEELEACLNEFEAPRGCAIVVDPKTGEILGMASRPHPNLNRLDDLLETGRNFAIQATYEPGSTIKLVAAAGALNERLVTPKTSIFCHHGFFLEGKVWVRDEHPAGFLTFEGVLEKSNNIGTYKLGRQLGVRRFYDYLSKFGYGQRTGILLSGEAGGRAKNTNNPMDFSRATYGYATAVTPLQVAMAYSVLAHDGKRRKPQIVKSVIANDGTVVEEFAPEVVVEVLRPEVAKQMRQVLERVTGRDGTAKLARVPGFRVAGKTGTATRMENGRYQKGHQTVSFAGMLPADDPAFVCVVVVDDPRTKKVNRFGGTIAGPCFSKIGRRVAAHLNLTPTEPMDGPLAGIPTP